MSLAFTDAVINSADAHRHRLLVSWQAASAQLMTKPEKPCLVEGGVHRRHMRSQTPTQGGPLTLDRCEASVSLHRCTLLHCHAQQLGTKQYGFLWHGPVFESSSKAAQLVMTPQRQLFAPELVFECPETPQSLQGQTTNMQASRRLSRHLDLPSMTRKSHMTARAVR